MTGTLRENNRLRRWEAALLAGVAVAMLWGCGWTGSRPPWRTRSSASMSWQTPTQRPTRPLKLRVRDRILAEAADLFAPGGDGGAGPGDPHPRPARPWRRPGRRWCGRRGTNTPLSASLEENVWFPTKQYTDFALPQGSYTALRVVIGEGGGRNWWCVVFPPLCLGSVTETTEGGRRPGGPEQEQRGPDDRRGRGLCGQIQGHRAVGEDFKGLGGGPLDGVFRSGFQTQWRQRKRFWGPARALRAVQWPHARGT